MLPMPIRQASSITQACTIAPWPMVTSSPITVANPPGWPYGPVVGDVHDAAVLHVAARADADEVDVAADRPRPARPRRRRRARRRRSRWPPRRRRRARRCAGAMPWKAADVHAAIVAASGCVRGGGALDCAHGYRPDPGRPTSSPPSTACAPRTWRIFPSYGERMALLERLEAAVRRHGDDLVAACSADFGRRAPLETLGADVDGQPRRDQARAPAPAPLDAPAAARGELQLPAGARRSALRAARRGRHRRAVELPVPAGDRAAGERARRRQPGHDQALGVHAARSARCWRDMLDEVFTADEVAGGAGRCRAERGLHAAALRPPAVHRLDRGRQAGDGRGGAEPDAGDAGTGRQMPGR